MACNVRLQHRIIFINDFRIYNTNCNRSARREPINTSVILFINILYYTAIVVQNNASTDIRNQGRAITDSD